MDGILLVLKPPGMTSFDVVAWLRGVFGIKKIGHAGTLDPAAGGLLPVCIGKAAKTIEWFSQFDKAYRAEMVLGIVTNTQDGEGEVVEENPVFTDRSGIESVLREFVGEIEQVPPMFSAVKIKGKRLYEFARQGAELERKSRKVRITVLRLLQAQLDLKHPVVRIDVECSKGTYIRTLCHDIGQRLGCGAYMSFLIRTRVGPFTLDDAVTLEEIQKCRQEGRLPSILHPADILFREYPSVVLEGESLKRFFNGAAAECGDEYGAEPGSAVRVYSGGGLFVGLGVSQADGGKTMIKPEKLFLPADGFNAQ